MTGPTLARDANGDILLTTAQVVALVSPPEDHIAVLEAMEAEWLPRDDGRTQQYIKAWVRRWAPVVEAVRLQAKADDILREQRAMHGEEAPSWAWRAWQDATDATESAYRAAIGGVP